MPRSSYKPKTTSRKPVLDGKGNPVRSGDGSVVTSRGFGSSKSPKSRPKTPTRKSSGSSSPKTTSRNGPTSRPNNRPKPTNTGGPRSRPNNRPKPTKTGGPRTRPKAGPKASNGTGRGPSKRPNNKPNTRRVPGRAIVRAVRSAFTGSGETNAGKRVNRRSRK